MSMRLERSTTNTVVGGVCGGIAEYLRVDPTLVRVAFVVGTVMTAGLGVVAYIALLVLMPLPGHPTPFVQGPAQPSSPTQPTAQSAADAPTAPAAPPTDPAAAERRRAAFGYVLIALGVVFLLGNIGAFRLIRWDLIWPLVFVGVGVLLLAQRVRR